MPGLPGQGVCPLPGTLCYLRGGRRHVQPAHCGGQADLDPAAGWGTAEEITMADVVPLNRRVDIRQEMEAEALHWLHAAAEEGPPSQGASGSEGGIVKPPPGGWLWPEPGTRWVLLKADVTKAHRRVRTRKDWRFHITSLKKE